MKKIRVLELFSGTHSVGKVCKEKNWDVVSLDLHNADINCDILQWDYKNEYPIGYFDIIWASPPCVFFSNLRRCCIGRTLKDGIIMTKEKIEDDIINKGLPILRKTEEIIKYFKPKYFFIENPQTGRMKNYMTDYNHYDVDYCKYGFDYRKRTRIWTNLKNFNAKLCKKDCGKMIKSDKRHFHRNNCGNNFYLKHAKQVSSYGGGTNRDMRYRIPSLLINDLLDNIQLP